MGTSKIKGKIFEWFVETILLKCGFTEVLDDNFLIYRRGQERMIHGLAQPHDADVLMYPPIQIPFYFPSRFLVECKAYKDKIGLPIVRGLLGLREDINNFDIVTPDILNKRRNYRRSTMATHSHDRFLYQTALAALNKVKITAQEFAIVHKIPIISFYNSERYKFLLSFISSINDDNKDEIWSDFNSCILSELINENNNNSVVNFVKKTNDLAKYMFAGVTDNGTVLLLYDKNKNSTFEQGNNLAEIHWATEESEWIITSSNDSSLFELSFELPNKIYDVWADKDFSKSEALKVKEEYFSRIVLFKKINNDEGVTINIIHLDTAFIKEAKRRLNDDE